MTSGMRREDPSRRPEYRIEQREHPSTPHDARTLVSRSLMRAKYGTNTRDRVRTACGPGCTEAGRMRSPDYLMSRKATDR